MSDLPNLAAARLGAEVIGANDEFFAPKENLLKEEPPIFVEGKYTDRGKWMDGWETRRRREPGHDWCVIRLGVPGVVRRLVVDTAHFKGNYPESCSLEGGHAEVGEPATWVELLSRTGLQGDTVHELDVGPGPVVTHLRFHIYPDGGVARLRAHGTVLPDFTRLTSSGDPIDLAAVEHGGSIASCSDMFFSRPVNLLLPGPPRNMGDGWETKRRRGPGHDWVVVRLGAAGTLRSAVVDTTHFKGNAPGSCSLDGALVESGDPSDADWSPLLGMTPLRPHDVHELGIDATDPVSHVRLNIFPDGGVARFRAHGTVSSDEVARRSLARVNALPAAAVIPEFQACCGSPAWAARLAAGRPFGSVDDLLVAARTEWAKVSDADRLEAFRAHPRIGEAASGGGRSAAWSAREQAAAGGAGDDVLSRLAAANRAYEDRFGHIFIVFASGKSAEEMLAILEERLGNDPATEMTVAAGEQAKITELRLRRSLGLEER